MERDKSLHLLCFDPTHMDHIGPDGELLRMTKCLKSKMIMFGNLNI